MKSWSIREDVIATQDNYRTDHLPPKGPDALAYPEPLILGRNLVFVYDRNRRDIVFVETEIA